MSREVEDNLGTFMHVAMKVALYFLGSRNNASILGSSCDHLRVFPIEPMVYRRHSPLPT